MKYVIPFLLLALGCATSPPPHAAAQEAARGPWSEVPAVEMPTGDTSIPIALLRDVADALLKRPGAKVCDSLTQRPIVGLSTEYCATVYVAGNRGSLSWRVTEPVMGTHESCEPFDAVADADYPASQVWIVGFVHNHPCGAPPSAVDLRAWPTDAFNPYVAMAEFRLIAGNLTASGHSAPAVHENTAIEMASAVVAELQDGTRIFLRYFPTGEVQQWSNVRAGWVTLGTCSPRGVSRSHTLRCRPDDPLQLLRE
jgi:proteasome lid subunit RPN8/RPN11